MSAARPPREPSPESLHNPLVRYFRATRPAFLSITFAGCALGFATAVQDGVAFAWPRAALALLLAALAHAATNVANDYFDHLNGSDLRNTGRLYPYTGGSRFIQNGVLTPRQVLGFALMLFAATVAGGAWLVAQTGVGLAAIGLAGLAIGWAYSAPPARLNSRGFGELAVAAGFLLVVVGADFVQRGAFALLPWLVGASYALLAANVLYVNQFPDREADRMSGKLHWVARLSPRAAALGSGLILALAALAHAAAIRLDALPPAALWALFAWIPGVLASRQLLRFAGQPAQLAPTIRMTLLAAHAQPLLLAVILLI